MTKNPLYSQSIEKLVDGALKLEVTLPLRDGQPRP